ncbi:TetR/AcrR family transcriptional regulator [Actinokineospora sp.]|uniref:TetR/AcrR family transcriptional regulator n=1 Tax=Actinokineospora sp. TaxID=1872133 RepID=UPI00403813AB
MRNEQVRGSLARTHEHQPGLPRGRSSLPADVVGSAQRDRLVRAMIASVAEQGYAAVMIADVVRRARVSRKAFYTHFADKEACFLSATDVGVELMFAHIEQAPRDLPEHADPQARLRAGLRAYLWFLAAEPEFAHVFLIGGLAAGPAAVDRFYAAHQRFMEINRRWHEDARRDHRSWPAVPDDAYVALVGAMHELVATRVRADRAADLPLLEDLAVRLHLAVFEGWPAC